MSERRGSDEPAPGRAARSSIDGALLARAAELNEAAAGEFAERSASPLEDPLLGRMAELGVQTEAVGVALQRAHRIAFDTRRGPTPCEPPSSAPTRASSPSGSALGWPRLPLRGGTAC
jgi:hypothetical protein